MPFTITYYDMEEYTDAPEGEESGMFFGVSYLWKAIDDEAPEEMLFIALNLMGYPSAKLIASSEIDNPSYSTATGHLTGILLGKTEDGYNTILEKLKKINAKETDIDLGGSGEFEADIQFSEKRDESTIEVLEDFDKFQEDFEKSALFLLDSAKIEQLTDISSEDILVQIPDKDLIDGYDTLSNLYKKIYAQKKPKEDKEDLDLPDMGDADKEPTDADLNDIESGGLLPKLP